MWTGLFGATESRSLLESVRSLTSASRTPSGLPSFPTASGGSAMKIHAPGFALPAASFRSASVFVFTFAQVSPGSVFTVVTGKASLPQ